ncbi:MAG: translation initiation factor IF-2 [Eubacteriales bacterium]|nr:translation initiation factor IF-2 [Eubacteriales bacterium]
MAVLETIKTIGDLVPEIQNLRARCRQACGELEVRLVDLRQKANDNLRKQEDEARQRINQEKYAELIKQREAEKLRAEKSFDAKIAGKKVAPNNQTTQPAKPTAATTSTAPAEPRKYQRSSFTFGRPGEPDTSMQHTKRPTPFNREQRPMHGQHPMNRGMNGQRPGKPMRTWTPGQATANGYGAKHPIGGAGRPNPNMGAPRANSGFLPRPTEKFVPKANTFDNKRKGKNHSNGEERSTMDRRALLRRGIIEEQEIEERMLTRVFRTKKSKENDTKVKVEKSNIVVIDGDDLTIKTLSEKIGKPVNQIIKQLMVLGEMCTINSVIDFDTAALVSDEFGIKLERSNKKTSEEIVTAMHKLDEKDENLQPRPPVVTVMGHVDHGKTTLLDRIRHSSVAAGESGGITQHIGAYQVEVAGNRKITFMDTPGHAAFDKMRARGAKITDIAVLIVAGDDGVMPQTVEAIHHIQNQNLAMIVAVTKCDKPEFNLDRVRTQLSEHSIIGEEWGGNTMIIPISAVTGEGVDKLLEMILLLADINNYRANYDKEASGAIIEAKMDPTRGAVVTILVQNGTLKVGDTLLAGTTSGKVRAMKDDRGHAIKAATPGMPVQVIGFNEVPNAGADVYVVDEKLTKQVVSERKNKEKILKAGMGKSLAGFDPLAAMKDTDKKQLNIILKADVSGSLEAIEQTLATIQSDEVHVGVISKGVGAVNDNDLDLASVTNALVITFNVKTNSTIQKNADRLKVKIYPFNVIYELFDFVTEQMVRLFTPQFETEHYGKVEVRALFKSSAAGQIAGCHVLDGKVMRNATVILMRGKTEVGKYQIESLKIKTDDQKEVLKGADCGIKLKDAPELKVGDIFDVIGEKQMPIIFNGKEYKF